MKKKLNILVVTVLSTVLLIPSIGTAGNVKKMYVNLSKEGQQAQASDVPVNYNQIETKMSNVSYSYVPNGISGTLTDVTKLNNEEYQFNGTTSIVRSDLKYNHLPIFTLESWIKPETVNRSFRIIVGSAMGNNLDAGILLEGNKFVFHTYSTQPGDVNIVTSTNTIEQGKWQHVAATYNNGQIKLYLNGKLNGIGSYILNDAKTTLIIGSAHVNNYDRAFKGQLKDVRIWNRELSQEEIEKYMDGFKGEIPSGLIGDYLVN